MAVTLGRRAVVCMAIMLAGCIGPASNGAETQPRTSSSTIGPETFDGPTGTAGDGPHQRITNKTTGHYQADVIGAIGNPGAAETNDMWLQVPLNATGLIVELRWTGDQSDFDIQVHTPTYCPESDNALVDDLQCEVRYLTQQEGPGAIIVSRPEGTLGPGELRAEFGPADLERERCIGSDECAWRVLALPDVAVDSDFDLRVTLFMEIAPPDDFTAFTD